MPERKRGRGFERRDVSGRALALFATGFAGFIAFSLLVLHLVYGDPPRAEALGIGITAAAEPRLEVRPRGDLAAFEADKARELATLGWVDRDAGIARIPIDEAVAIVAASGLPHWQGGAAAAGDGCAMLEANIPRAPQARHCRGGGQP